MVGYYVECYEKEELVTNFLQKKSKKKIIEKWLSVFVSMFESGQEEDQEKCQLESISEQFYQLQLKLKAMDGLKALKE